MSAVSQEMWSDDPEPGGGGRDPWQRLSGADWRRLFDGVAKARSDALELLYDAAARKVYGLALWRTGSEEDARDVVQEVFVRLAQQQHRLGRVRDPRSWLLAVAHRAAVDVVRRRQRRKGVSLDETPLLLAADQDRDRAVDCERASRLLAQLPLAQRDAVYLHVFAGCTFAEVGRIVGVPTFTAASRYRLGLRRLRRLMEGER